MRNQNTEYCLQDHEQMCFVHIPKTAGTTMSALLEARFDHQRICPTPYWRELKQMPKASLQDYQLFRGHFPYRVGELVPKTPVYITMLRDPIERVISAYEFMKTCIIMHPRAKRVQEKARTLPLKDYVRDPEVNGVVNSQTLMVAGRESGDITSAMDPVWLEVAKANLQQFAWVGITEQFWDSVALLSYQFGWVPPDEIQRLMVGSKKLRRENLSQDVIDIISEYNQLDLEFYEYAKALYQSNYSQMLEQLQQRYGSETAALASGVNGVETSDTTGFPAEAEAGTGAGTKSATTTGAETEAQQHLVRSLLNRHYETCFQQAKETLTPTTRIHFTLDQAVPGNGWHRLEGLERNEPFRWTGPRTISTLDFALDLTSDLALEFRILNSTTSDAIQSLKVRANGQLLKLIPLHRDPTGAMFRCTIPTSIADPSKPFTRLSFHVDDTIPFNTIHLLSDDRRRVGVAISLVQIFPIDSRPEVEMIESPIDSAPWFDAIAFLKQQMQPGQHLFGPNIFRLAFPDYLPYEGIDNVDLTINYVARTLTGKDYDWVIIHKGVQDAYVGSLLLQILTRQLKPVFANSVFVIFAKQSPLKSLGYGHKDVRSALSRYIKYWANQLAHVTGAAQKKLVRGVKRLKP